MPFPVEGHWKAGAPGGIRTHNLPLRRRMLCPLSHGRTHLHHSTETNLVKFQVVKPSSSGHLCHHPPRFLQHRYQAISGFQPAIFSRTGLCLLQYLYHLLRHQVVVILQ